MKNVQKKFLKLGVSSALVATLGTVGVQTITPISVLASTNNYENLEPSMLTESDVQIKNLFQSKRSTLQNTELMEKYNMSIEERSLLETKRESSNNTFDSERQIDLLKLEFQEKYGIDNRFIQIAEVIVEDEKYITEVNGYTGEYRVLLNNEIIVEINYFEGLDLAYDNYIKQLELTTQSPSLRATIPDTFSGLTTGGPDELYMRVSKSGSTYNITIDGAFSSSKRVSYTKANNWYSGNTKNYYNNLKDAESDWNDASSYWTKSAEGIVRGIISGIIASGKFSITAAAVIAALTGIDGITNLVMTANYLVQYAFNVGQTHYYYNILR